MNYDVSQWHPIKGFSGSIEPGYFVGGFLSSDGRIVLQSTISAYTIMLFVHIISIIILNIKC